jgi:reactive intermediate/imine deaminase
MNKTIINTSKAPLAIGTYSQAVKAGNFLYISGQIPLPADNSGKDISSLVSQDFAQQVVQVFANIKAICNEAGGELSDIIKLNVSLTDLSKFAILNTEMEKIFSKPYPARAAVEVSGLPKDAQVEIEAIVYLQNK